MTAEVIIRLADSSEHIERVRRLFLEYAQSLDFSLCLQGFDAELQDIAHHHGSPQGALLLASVGGDPAGCVGVRPFGGGACEMKRLYVRPAFRRRGVGRALVIESIRRAREAGHRTMLLDTVPTMLEAIALYRSLGFVEEAPYRHNPIPGAVFMELDLTKA